MLQKCTAEFKSKEVERKLSSASSKQNLNLWIYFGKKTKMENMVSAKSSSVSKHETMGHLDRSSQSLPEKLWPLQLPLVGLWDHRVLWLNLLSASQPGTKSTTGPTRLSSEQAKQRFKDGMQVHNQCVSRSVTSTKLNLPATVAVVPPPTAEAHHRRNIDFGFISVSFLFPVTDRVKRFWTIEGESLSTSATSQMCWSSLKSFINTNGTTRNS